MNTILTPSRSIALQGASNFRDLGGYVGHDGRAVQWRRLFRSDHLGGLTVQDKAALADLGITRTADFRGLDERAAQAYEISQVQQHALSIEPTVVQRTHDMLSSGHQMTEADTVRLMQELYHGFVHTNARRFAQLFELLLENNDPIIFHCTAGKDRTGFAAALILMGLGVSRSVVMKDYLLTNELYARPASVHSTVPPQVLAVLWRVQEDFLNASLHMVEAEFGDVPTYLDRVLKISPAAQKKLAEMYLEAA